VVYRKHGASFRSWEFFTSSLSLAKKPKQDPPGFIQNPPSAYTHQISSISQYPRTGILALYIR
jgi:hypothetical protein